MNYFFLDVSTYTAQKNNAEKEAVDLIQKFHRFVISDEDLKPLVEFLTQQIDCINKKHKRCNDIRFSFKEGYSDGNWIFDFCDSYKISFRLIKQRHGKAHKRPMPFKARIGSITTYFILIHPACQTSPKLIEGCRYNSAGQRQFIWII